MFVSLMIDIVLICDSLVIHGKSIAAIEESLGIDLSVDPETIYHPYPLVQKVFQTCGTDYHNHEKESRSFLSTLSVEDYENLRRSNRCKSFGKFVDSLLASTIS